MGLIKNCFLFDKRWTWLSAVHTTLRRRNLRTQQLCFYSFIRLPSTLNERNCPPKTELFGNARQTGGILKAPSLRFSVNGERELFENDDVIILM